MLLALLSRSRLLQQGFLLLKFVALFALLISLFGLDEVGILGGL